MRQGHGAAPEETQRKHEMFGRANCKQTTGKENKFVQTHSSVQMVHVFTENHDHYSRITFHTVHFISLWSFLKV